jgi:hypothetical protein
VPATVEEAVQKSSSELGWALMKRNVTSYLGPMAFFRTDAGRDEEGVARLIPLGLAPGNWWSCLAGISTHIKVDQKKSITCFDLAKRGCPHLSNFPDELLLYIILSSGIE